MTRASALLLIVACTSTSSVATNRADSVPDTTMDPSTSPPTADENGTTESRAIALQRFGGSLRDVLVRLASTMLNTGSFADEQIQGGQALGSFFIHIRRFALMEVNSTELDYAVSEQRVLPSGEQEAQFILIGPRGERRGLLVRTNAEITEINLAEVIY